MATSFSDPPSGRTQLIYQVCHIGRGARARKRLRPQSHTDKTNEDDGGEQVEELSCFQNLIVYKKKDARDRDAVTVVLGNLRRVALIDSY
jgi:hypothetical protein